MYGCWYTDFIGPGICVLDVSAKIVNVSVLDISVRKLVYIDVNE